MGKSLKQHMKPFLEDCKAYMAKLQFFSVLKEGMWLSATFIEGRKDIYGRVNWVKISKESVIVSLDLYSIANSLEKMKTEVLVIHRTYSPGWESRNHPYDLTTFNIIKNQKMFKVLYGPKV